MSSQDFQAPSLATSRGLVLVVEDNDKNARLTTAMLESAGYRTMLACDGKAGLEAAINHGPILIITDLQMPGMDGVEMTRALRSRADTASIPIIAVSAHALGEHGRDALAAGCQAFLTKPFRYREFLEAVESALREQIQPAAV